MKRTLYDSITVIQGASGKVVDRNGCLSAVFVADVSAVSGSPTTSAIGIVVTHCDTESGTYEEVPDDCLFVGCEAKQAIEAGMQTCWQIDLIACNGTLRSPPHPHLQAAPALPRPHLMRWCLATSGSNDYAGRQCVDHTGSPDDPAGVQRRPV